MAQIQSNGLFTPRAYPLMTAISEHELVIVGGNNSEGLLSCGFRLETTEMKFTCLINNDNNDQLKFSANANQSI